MNQFPTLSHTTMTAESARRLVRRTLVDLPSRLAHSLAVGQKAETVVRALHPQHAAYLAPAAYLHDIGYATTATKTGLHQLDGARYLRGLGADDVLARLVAWHSFAEFETAERGYTEDLEVEFPAVTDDLRDILGLLTYCDMTTSANGEPTTVDERFASIYERYEIGHLVERAMRQAEPLVRDLVTSVERRLREVERVSA